MIENITVHDLSHQEQSALNALFAQLRQKAPRNRLRSAYYDGKNAVRDLGISTPPQFSRIATVLGWSAKAVDILNDRCVLDGFRMPGGDVADTGLLDVWDANYLDVEFPQATTSALIHSVAFLLTHEGDVAAGEPRALVTAADGMSSTATWNSRRRVLDSFLHVSEFDSDENPTAFMLVLPGVNISCRRQGGRWAVERRQHDFGVPVEPLVFRPRLSRPFGTSRISRAVMSLHDSAIRTVIRSELSAEMYSVPQRVLLGADESAFRNADGSVKSVWQAVLGRLWAIPDDEDATNPRAEVKEFTSGSQEPHVAQLRAWAQLFAGETSIAISSLGISTTANPESADAYAASREDLVKLAESTTDGFTPALRRTAVRALRIEHGWGEDQVPAEVLGIVPKWRNATTPSRAAAADAAAKTIDKFPWLADSELGLELYGLPQDFIDRAMAEKRRSGGSAALRAITEAAAQGRTVTGQSLFAEG